MDEYAFARAGSAYNEPDAGMLLVDYFAGQALTGMLSHQYALPDRGDPLEFARLAYRIAKAMLVAREEALL